MSKYNFDLDLSGKNSLSLILRRIEPNSTVLEFGPANGRMTKYLKEVMGCKVYTVELDEEAAKDAANYSEKIIIGNIEEYEWLHEYADIAFDYIVFADVLEHLYDPFKVLKSVKELLKEEGSILFSIPNIAHNAIIMELLEDKFTYKPVGLLDNTHIRFFTKNSLDEFISSLGYHTVYKSGVFVPPSHTEFQHDYTELENCVGEYLEQRELGEVYQFVYELKKHSQKLVSELGRYFEFKLYFDDGSGFNEINTMTKELKNNQVVFDLSTITKEIIKIRIDPTERAVKFGLKSLKVDAQEYKDKIEHNGIDEEEGIKFLHHDPQIIITFDKLRFVTTLSMHLENFLTIKNLSNQILAEKEREIMLLVEQLAKKEKSLEKKDEQLQKKEQIIEEKDRKIQEFIQLAESMRIKNRIKRLFQFRRSEKV